MDIANRCTKVYECLFGKFVSDLECIVTCLAYKEALIIDSCIQVLKALTELVIMGAF